MSDALRRWGQDLSRWGIPQEILDRAPENPWAYPAGLFARATGELMDTDTPSRRRAAEALPPGGSVIDVGCGAGAGSLPLVPPAASVIGVDQSKEMLAEFATLAAERGAEHREIQGLWPDAATEAGVADVAVCYNVLYNVADLEPFARALTRAARRRVVIEMTERHPTSWMSPLWLQFHELERPTRPTADDAIAALLEMGLSVQAERFEGASRLRATSTPAELVSWVRVMLCLPSSREPEIAAAIGREPMPSTRGLVTIWWDGAG